MKYGKFNYKYQTKEDYSLIIDIHPVRSIKTPFIELSSCGILKIKKYYAWNGANVAFDTDTLIRASLVHDALYQLIREGHLDKSYRPQVDNLFAFICKEDGMSSSRSWYIHKAVSLFGRFYL